MFQTTNQISMFGCLKSSHWTLKHPPIPGESRLRLLGRHAGHPPRGVHLEAKGQGAGTTSETQRNGSEWQGWVLQKKYIVTQKQGGKVRNPTRIVINCFLLSFGGLLQIYIRKRDEYRDRECASMFVEYIDIVVSCKHLYIIQYIDIQDPKNEQIHPW